MIKHLALVMDGNRRWAQGKGLAPWLGHSNGVDAVKRSVEFCIEKKIPYLSLYVFSLENLRRSPQEVNFLFDLIVSEGERWLDDLIKQGIRVRFIGDRSLFPTHLLPTINKLEQTTSHLTTLEVLLLFCYGGQQEILNGIKHIARNLKQGLISEEDITDEVVRSVLWANKIPDPDLIIRAGGRQRLSNFLLYQAAYSELYFLDCLWPDIQKADLENAVYKFEQVQRNFGS
jgi:undecaprenyl diphosphate synthase